eukprot:sb/3477434/
MDDTRHDSENILTIYLPRSHTSDRAWEVDRKSDKKISESCLISSNTPNKLPQSFSYLVSSHTANKLPESQVSYLLSSHTAKKFTRIISLVSRIVSLASQNHVTCPSPN